MKYEERIYAEKQKNVLGEGEEGGGGGYKDSGAGEGDGEEEVEMQLKGKSADTVHLFVRDSLPTVGVFWAFGQPRLLRLVR